MGRLFCGIKLQKCQVHVLPKSLRREYNQYNLHTAALHYGPLSPLIGRLTGELRQAVAH
jgi:hypothetical protein